MCYTDSLYCIMQHVKMRRIRIELLNGFDLQLLEPREKFANSKRYRNITSSSKLITIYDTISFLTMSVTI